MDHAGAHNESSVVRRQERDTPTHLIKIPNLYMMDVLLKIDWMMADAVRKKTNNLHGRRFRFTTLETSVSRTKGIFKLRKIA